MLRNKPKAWEIAGQARNDDALVMSRGIRRLRVKPAMTP